MCLNVLFYILFRSEPLDARVLSNRVRRGRPWWQAAAWSPPAQSEIAVSSGGVGDSIVATQRTQICLWLLHSCHPYFIFYFGLCQLRLTPHLCTYVTLANELGCFLWGISSYISKYFFCTSKIFLNFQNTLWPFKEIHGHHSLKNTFECRLPKVKIYHRKSTSRSQNISPEIDF